MVALLVVLLAVGGIFAATSWNSANLKGSGTITVTGSSPTPPTASVSGTVTADSNSIGTIATGATLNIGGVSTVTHTLGIASTSVSNIVPGTYGFKLQADTTQRDALVAYFGTMGGNATYVTDIGNEINGSLPFFFLNISGTTVNIYDGFQDQLGNHTAPLVINDNYPVGTYTYTGSLTGANGASNLPVTVTLTVAEPVVWEIGGNIVMGGSTPVTTLALITCKDSTNTTTKWTMSVIGGETLIVEKGATDILTSNSADVSLVAVPVAYKN